jgi:peptide/nickel transport system substrate-binding protein
MRRALWTSSVALALLLVAAACGDSGGGDDNTSPGTTAQAGPTTTLAPVVGGTLKISPGSEPPSLDPIANTASSATGGMEMTAIFDTLVQWDAANKKYVYLTAESVTPSADFKSWEIKIRPNIKFTDGTAYDAEAVAFNLQRSRSGTTGAKPCAEVWGCPRNVSAAAVPMSVVANVEVTGPLTVKVTLNESYAGFPWILSGGAGMIGSPSAIKKCDAAAPVLNCAFSKAPVGAGPFILQKWTPKESMVMVRNPNYWGGQVYLDGLNFFEGGAVGGQPAYDLYKTGGADVSFLFEPPVTADAIKDNVPRFVQSAHPNTMIVLNNGLTVACAAGKPEPLCTGKPDGPITTKPPTSDIRVRQAMLASVDPKILNDKAYAGKARTTTDLFEKSFPWAPDTPQPSTYDPDKAKKLVAEAKAAGWDGKVRLLIENSPADSMNLGLALEAMFRSVGMDPQLDLSKDFTGRIAQVTTVRDYDVVIWGIVMGADEGFVWPLTQNLISTSASNRAGYKSAAMDAALLELLRAKTDAEKKTADGKIAALVAQDVPFIPVSARDNTLAMPKNLRGATDNTLSMANFGKAWLAK